MIIKTAALFCFIYAYQLIGQEVILTLRSPSEMISGPFIKHEKTPLWFSKEKLYKRPFNKYLFATNHMPISVLDVKTTMVEKMDMISALAKHVIIKEQV